MADRERKNGNGRAPLDCWALFDIVVRHLARILLVGPPGTGKTRNAVEIARQRGVPAVMVTLTEETPAAELRGFFVPWRGRFRWVDGPVLLAMRQGGVLVINEIDHASPDALSFLLAALDDPAVAQVVLPNGEVVEPAPGYACICTMNGDPATLPSPLLDRFSAVLRIDRVHPQALLVLPPDLQRAARETVALPAERRISPRAWYAVDRLRRCGVEEEIALAIVFGDRAGEVLDALRLMRSE